MRRVLVSALAGGCLAGLIFFALQAATLLPLIQTAERYERAAAAAMPEHTEPGGWQPEEGGERLAYTALTDVVTGIGFALLLVGGFSLQRGTVGLRRGLVWGLAGYAVFALAPGLGLPPAPPGSAAADLAARQAWWLGTALATAAGLALLVFGRRRSWQATGALLLVLPHLVGAPRPEAPGGTAPPELAVFRRRLARRHRHLLASSRRVARLVL